ncbi:MAG: tripartite tricarboxylate transporter substrate binding protein [Candidatus Binatia bacterium]
MKKVEAFLSLLVVAAVVATGAPMASRPAGAQEKYPSKPITILIGFSVGGSMDTAARLQGEVMSKVLGVPIVYRNVAGAGGRNSVTILNRSKPDGYTMAAINVPGQVVNMVVRGLPPDLRTFTWIGRQVSMPYFLQASKKSPWKSLKQMKKAKKPIRAAITGTGGNTFPISVIASDIVGYPVRFIIGFKAPEMIAAIIRGDVDVTTMPLSHRWYSAVKAGDARAIAVYTPERHPVFPSIPTGVEEGFPELGKPTLLSHNLYALPPGTPSKIAGVLESALVKANGDKKTKQKIEATGSLVRPISGKDTGLLLEDMFSLVKKNSSLLKKYIKTKKKR